MIEFIAALAGFLLSRLLWDYIRRRARAMNEIPIVWFCKTVALLVPLVAILCAFGIILIYLVTR